MSFLSIFLFMFGWGCAAKDTDPVKPVSPAQLPLVKKGPSLDRWQGELQLPNGPLELVVDFGQGEKNGSAVLHVPSQGLTDHALQKVDYRSDGFHFEIHKGNAAFNEIYDCKRTVDKASCTLKMNGQSFQMSMTKTNDFNRPLLASDKRPQKPVSPFPYDSIELTHLSPVDQSPRTGTLTMPHGEGPFPVIVIESGSGAQDRDGNIMGHAFYHVLADMLSRQGIAVYRVDDRGKGGSTGDPWAGYDTLSKDLVAAIELMKAQPKVDTSRMGIAGHSQGAAVGPMAALNSSDISFLILIGGPGLNGDKLMTQQKRDALKAVGIQGEFLEKRMKAYTSLMESVVQKKDDDAIEKSLRALFDIEIPLAYRKVMPKGQFEALFAQSKKSMTSQPMRDLICYKPIDYLPKLTIPVLAIFGEKDTQVSPVINQKGMDDLFAQAENEKAKTILIAGMNHVFQPAKTGLVTEYKEIDISVMPELSQTILTWLKNTSAKPEKELD